MGNSVVANNGIRAQQRSLNTRVTELETHVAKLAMGVNQRVGAVEQRVGRVEEVVDALVEMEGNGVALREFMENARIARLRAGAEAEKAALERGVADGYVIKTDVVEERSILIGHFISPSGEIEVPGRYQCVVPGISQEFREKVIGKAVGYVLEMPGKRTFTIDEVYNVDEEKFKAAQAAAQAAAEAEAKVVAQADEAEKASAEADEVREAMSPKTEDGASQE